MLMVLVLCWPSFLPEALPHITSIGRVTSESPRLVYTSCKHMLNSNAL